MRGTRETEVMMGIDVGDGGCNRLQQEIARLVKDVVSVLPNMALSYESLGEAGAELMSEVAGGEIVWKDVGGG